MIEDKNIYCSNCGRNANMTDILNIYECKGCQDYFKVTIKNDHKTYSKVSENVNDIFKLNRELEVIQGVASEIAVALNKPNVNFFYTCLIFLGIIIIPMGVILPDLEIFGDSIYKSKSLQEAVLITILVWGLSFIIIFFSYKQKKKLVVAKKNNKLQINQLLNRSKEIEKMIASRKRDLLDKLLE